MTKECHPEYLAKVAQLSPEETERLLSRMTGKLPRRLERNKLTYIVDPSVKTIMCRV